MRHGTIVLLLILSFASSIAGGVGFERLLCEYTENPANIDVARPRFSWVVSSRERGQGQTACRVMVSTSPDEFKSGNPNMWDSGRIETDATLHLEYRGAPLKSNTRYFWRVEIWDRHGTPNEVWRRFQSSLSPTCWDFRS